MTRLTDFHRDYWNAFEERARADGAGVPSFRRSNRYMIFRGGVGGAHLAASVLVSRKVITFYLLLEGEHRNEMYEHLSARKNEIDAELGEAPVWKVWATSNRARVTVELNVDNPDVRKDWPRQHHWIMGRAKAFDSAFWPRLHALKATP